MFVTTAQWKAFYQKIPQSDGPE